MKGAATGATSAADVAAASGGAGSGAVAGGAVASSAAGSSAAGSSAAGSSAAGSGVAASAQAVGAAPGAAPVTPGAAPVTPGIAPPEAIRRLARRTRWHAGRLRRSVAAALGRLAMRWGRSLQLRVVTTTLVVSAIVVTLLGFFLMQQIASGQLLAQAKQDGVVVGNGAVSAGVISGVNSPPGSNAVEVMAAVAKALQPSGTGSPIDYGVAVIPAPGYASSALSSGMTAGNPVLSNLTKLQLPSRLMDAVTRMQRRGGVSVVPQYAPASVNPPGSGGPVPGLAFGIPLGDYYQLYYFFPTTGLQQNLTQVQRTLLGVGVALVFLLAAVAWLVTRWVVAPVRQAARGAQRLAAGNLDERMQVRGTDELAALATSFNEMAAGLQEKMQELEGLSQVQRQFVSDVSHELRTPLTTIRIAADVLFGAREELDAAPARSAELLQGQLERFEALLVDLLEISRHDANVAVLDPEAVDVCDLVRHSADVAQQLAERRGAKIEFRLPADPCVADVDRRRVERILRNLLVNAVEHGEGKDVAVTVAGDSGAVAVAVRDYGVGLAAGEERYVFDRFWRADPARARTTGGTGLGLSIALEDARLHGGWLEAWGAHGQGSVFRLTLPRAAGAELAGSPLPLGPDEADLAALGPTVAAPPQVAGDSEAVADD
jgi:two-component system, OmpR family, sensor histidine kinase MtrB